LLSGNADRVTFSRFLASGFGSGFFPVAPGTAGSLVALLIGAGLLHVSIWALLLAALMAIGAGLWAIRASGGAADPGWVVIDEFAGQWIALLGLARPSWSGLLAAFVLFRFFDIVKPGPIAWADRRKDAVGVMGDDVIAGALAAFFLVAARALAPGFLD
jgi:phosphatidylglycerophosphatase A